MTPDVIYDQPIPGWAAPTGSSSRGVATPAWDRCTACRDAVEDNRPRPLDLEERSHADMANAYVAGASGLPFAVLRAYAGTDYPKHNPRIATVTCPFTGERLTAVPAIRLDTTIIHAQQADRRGNVQLWGIPRRAEGGGAGGEEGHRHRRRGRRTSNT